MRKREILLTFDYELFLGSNSGTAHDCMLQPTKRLAEILDKHEAKAILFVDTTYLWKLQREAVQHPELRETLSDIVAQVRELSTKHYVYLHIHPHWMDAKYDAQRKTWDLSDATKFTVSNLTAEERSKLLHECYELLQSASSTAVEGYRAGGLFIQPFSDIKSFFETCKLQYEFSVYKGFTSIHDTMKCDFSQAPDSTIYRFEEDVCKESKEGKFTQFSISNFEMKGISRIINSIYYRYIMRQGKSKRYGKGQGARHVLSNNEKHVSMWDTVNESFSVELMNPWKNTLYANYLKTHTYLHFLSHPKLVSEMNLESLDAFLSQAKKKYEVEFDFKKFNY